MTNPIRRTLQRIEKPGDGRYLTFSCYGRMPLFGNDLIKDLMVERIALVRHALDFRLYAWVVMPEHVHMLVQTEKGEETIDEILTRIKSRFARQVLARWRELKAGILPRLMDASGNSHFWQTGGGYDRNLVSESEWMEKITYIHNNPVRRGLVSVSSDWKWSSARWYDGEREGPQIDPLW